MTNVLVLSFVATLAVAVLLGGALFWVWRKILRTSRWRRLVLSALISAGCAPIPFAPCGPPVIFPAVLLVIIGLADGLLLYGLAPIAVVTALNYALWSVLRRATEPEPGEKA